MKKIYFYIAGLIILILLLLIPMAYPKHRIKEKYLLISIHDTTPRYESQINQFLTELEKRNINNFTFLVTPNWHGNYSISNYPKFIEKLNKFKNNGAELVLHGYEHKGPEFLHLDKKEAEEKLTKSIELYRKAFNSTPNGFIPPLWKQSDATYELLKDEGFRYTETFRTLEYFSGKKYKGFPLGMESGSSDKYLKYDKISPLLTKLFSNIYARLIWNKGGVVRYTIHPREVDIGNLNATLKLLDGFLKRGWKPVIYSELEGK